MNNVIAYILSAQSCKGLQWLVLVLLNVVTQSTLAQEPGAMQANKKEPTTNASEAEDSPVEATKKDRAPHPNKAQAEQRQLKLTAAQIQGGEVVWLNASGEEFLALWQADVSGTPQGAVLMLHHAGQTLDWPPTFRNLRENLTDFGWSTLSISLPNPNPATIPNRRVSGELAAKSISTEIPKKAAEETTEATEEDKPEASESDGGEPLQDNSVEVKGLEYPPVEPKAFARIQAAIQFLYTKGQFNIALLGDGLGGIRGSQYAYKSASAEMSTQRSQLPKGAKAERPFRAIVLLNTLNQTPEIPDFEVDQVFADAEIPVLDIIYLEESLIKEALITRAQAAKKAQVQIYTQRKVLAPQNVNSHQLKFNKRSKENRLTRIIRGFLDRYAAGVKMKTR